MLIAIATIIVIGSMLLGWQALHRRSNEEVRVPGPLVDPALRARTLAHAAASPPAWQPRAAADAHPATEAVGLALRDHTPALALTAAEEATIADGADGRAHVLLAWVMCFLGQPFAAEQAMERGRRLGATGPLADYVDARAGFVMFEHRAGETAAVPLLVTAADLAVVTLAGAQRGGAWLAGTQDVEILPEQISYATAEHRRATARGMALLLSALDVAPGFADARFWLGRIAIKAGMVPAGKQLLASVWLELTNGADAEAYKRDLECLRDPAAALAAATTPPPEPVPAPPPTSLAAKRSKSLRVL